MTTKKKTAKKSLKTNHGDIVRLTHAVKALEQYRSGLRRHSEYQRDVSTDALRDLKQLLREEKHGWDD